MLRASVEMQGGEVDLNALTDAGAAAESGVEHGAVLIEFAEAVVRQDEPAMVRSRAAVRAVLGDLGLIDAAGIVANFQRMVRIADATGIPLDAPVEMLSADVRAGLGVDAYAGAANTPAAGGLQRAFFQPVRVEPPYPIRVDPQARLAALRSLAGRGLDPIPVTLELDRARGRLVVNEKCTLDCERLGFEVHQGIASI